jgi:ribosome-binding protein aMBF1 (putative translation factor)
MTVDTHANDPQTITLKRKRPQAALPTRPTTIKPNDHIDSIEKPKLDISIRIAHARILKGYNTRHDLAKALNMNVDIINCIESRNGKEKYNKQHVNKICQHLHIKST